jgi:anti-sigma factor RsiW
MNTHPADHIVEDVLELYAMGKLSDEESAPLEEHLLLCLTCQTRLADTDDYIGAAKGAARALDKDSESRFHRLISGSRPPRDRRRQVLRPRLVVPF